MYTESIYLFLCPYVKRKRKPLKYECNEQCVCKANENASEKLYPSRTKAHFLLFFLELPTYLTFPRGRVFSSFFYSNYIRKQLNINGMCIYTFSSVCNGTPWSRAIHICKKTLHNSSIKRKHIFFCVFSIVR